MDRMSECIRRLMQQNIVVAVGCTEPVAVALCVAKAKEILGKEVERVELFLSGNIVKNAMGVGIPGTGKIGLPIAVALGVVCGDSSKQLQVLCSAKEHVNQAQQWLEKHTIDIKTKDTKEKLYIECHCYALNESAVAVISGTHTNFVHTEKNGEVLFHQDCKQEQQGCSDDAAAQNLTALQVWEYATLTPLEELQWIDETVTLNDKCSQQSLDGEYGLRIGKKLYGCWDKSIRAEIIGRTCAASDARMDGITLPIYSNSGSGNQGITCTLPVYYYGIKKNADKESITRALTLSHLMSIYIKSKIGRLSALCGVVNASMGAASGIALLAGCSFKQMCFALNNMINTITGMVCDGAKPSCALKISAGLNSAFDSVLLALDDIVVDTTDGIADADIDKSIASIGKIGRYGMDETDKLILDIMTEKNCSR
ncbi:MAG: serine dehydratase subunit alpha family protein [Bacteroidales bacterium]|nr:serine dehydratase subunit alpha family protein [Bacteroidales bacterium]